MYRISFKLQRRFTIAMKTWLALMLLTKTTFKAAMAECPALNSSSSRLGSRSETLRYTDQSQSKTDTWCGWSFPASKLADHVIFLKIVSLSMFRGTCMGQLNLPSFKPFCEMPVNSCFVFTPRNSCDRQATFDFFKNGGCTSIFWSFHEHDSLQIRYRSRAAGMKTFSFMYKMISCRQDPTPEKPKQTSSISTTISGTKAETESSNGNCKNQTEPQTGVSSVSEAGGNTGNNTSQSKSETQRGVSSVALVGVIIVFTLLLLACLLLILLLYRRLRKLKSRSLSARVQYEIAKPRDITVLRSANVDETSDSPSRQTNFSLHGEHHTSNHTQDDVTMHDEEPVERHYSSIEDLSRSDDAPRSVATMPPLENREVTTDETCVYATVNKRRSTIAN